MNKEAISLMASKYELDTHPQYQEFIRNEMLKGLSDKIANIIHTGDDIMIEKPDLRTFDVFDMGSVEFRETVSWQPIVRCKDCKFREKEEPGMVYCPNIVGGWVEEDFFCKGGKKGVKLQGEEKNE